MYVLSLRTLGVKLKYLFFYLFFINIYTTIHVLQRGTLMDLQNYRTIVAWWNNGYFLVTSVIRILFEIYGARHVLGQFTIQFSILLFRTFINSSKYIIITNYFILYEEHLCRVDSINVRWGLFHRKHWQCKMSAMLLS